MKRTVWLFGFVACFLFTACTQNSRGTNEAVSEINLVKSSRDTLEEADEFSEEKIYKIGKSAILEDWKIKLKKVKIVKSIKGDSYGEFRPDEKGSKYVQAFLKITNKGKEVDIFLPSFGLNSNLSTKIQYRDEYEFSSVNLFGYHADAHDTTINPMSFKNKEVIFEIPNSVVKEKDEMFLQFTFGDDSVTFKIR